MSLTGTFVARITRQDVHFPYDRQVAEQDGRA